MQKRIYCLILFILFRIIWGGGADLTRKELPSAGAGNVLHLDRSSGSSCMHLSKIFKCTLTICAFHCMQISPQEKKCKNKNKLKKYLC